MSHQAGVVWFLRAAEETIGDAVVITLEGRISKATAEELKRLLESRNVGGIKTLIVDLAAVDYLNGAGLRVFETAAARFADAGRQLVVCGLRPVVRATFDLAGAIPNLLVADSRDDSLRRVAGTLRADVKKA